MAKKTILYHYCSNKSFHSIIENKEIRLSSLALSNDSKEGKLVVHTIIELAKKDRLNPEHIDRIKEIVTILYGHFEGLGFCLSASEDQLSQWRGYADDATGISIGFSKDYLMELEEASRDPKEAFFRLQKVKYKKNEHVKSIKPTYNEIKKLIGKGVFKSFRGRTLSSLRTPKSVDHYNELYHTIMPLYGDLFLLKSKTFKEESEWRLISHFVKTGEDHCLFYSSSDKIIPYRKFPLLKLKQKAIEKIFIGSKNNTPEYVIDSFLKQNGFQNVKVVRSDSSYR